MIMQHISEDEKAILAPAVRRAGAILLHWQDNQNLEGIRVVLDEITDPGQMMDITLALLLLQDDCIREHLPPSLLLHIVHRAALKENR
jgi:hypothetical protein